MREISPLENDKNASPFDFFSSNRTLLNNKNEKEVLVSSDWTIEFYGREELKIYVEDFKKFVIDFFNGKM